MYESMYVHQYIYIYRKMQPPPLDGSTILLFEGYFGDGMQLFYLECLMRLDQHQLTLKKEILVKIQFGIRNQIMCFSLKRKSYLLSLKIEILVELCPCLLPVNSK